MCIEVLMNQYVRLRYKNLIYHTSKLSLILQNFFIKDLPCGQNSGYIRFTEDREREMARVASEVEHSLIPAGVTAIEAPGNPAGKSSNPVPESPT